MAYREQFEAWDAGDVSDGAEASIRPADYDFLPGERIGQPLPNRGRRIVRRAVTWAALGACGWAAAQTAPVWQPWLTTAVEQVRTEWTRTDVSLPAAPVAPIPANLAPPVDPLGPPTEVAAIPGTAPAPSPPATGPESHAPPNTEAAPAEPPAPSDFATSSVEPSPAAAPLPAPEADPANSHEKRALAAGLHPRISGVVLASLSEADYKNATTAIRRALAEAPDGDKFVWPRDPAGKLAVFQVHFVTGTSDKCRRYVVTVVKNGWTTTAPPMEKCGIATPPPNTTHAARSSPAAPSRRP